MPDTCVLAGVYPGQSLAVIRESARLAGALGIPLVCAYVDPARYAVTEAADGSVISAPLDPDFVDDGGASFPSGLGSALATEIALQSTALSWRTVLLAGDPAAALIQCSQTLEATMIVVGTRGTSQSSLSQVFHHSVTTKLAREQRRPALVIPTHLEPSKQRSQSGPPRP